MIKPKKDIEKSLDILQNCYNKLLRQLSLAGVKNNEMISANELWKVNIGQIQNNLKKLPGKIPTELSSDVLQMAENLYKRGNIEKSAEFLAFLGRGDKDEIEKKLFYEFQSKSIGAEETLRRILKDCSDINPLIDIEEVAKKYGELLCFRKAERDIRDFIKDLIEKGELEKAAEGKVKLRMKKENALKNKEVKK